MKLRASDLRAAARRAREWFVGNLWTTSDSRAAIGLVASSPITSAEEADYWEEYG